MEEKIITKHSKYICWFRCVWHSSSVRGFLVVQTLPILDAYIYTESVYMCVCVCVCVCLWVRCSSLVWVFGVVCAWFGDHLHLQAGIPHRHPCWVQLLYPGIRYSSRKCYRRGSTSLHTHSWKRGFSLV